ncbi:MAG: ATP-dependent Clp protease proteolytic subunit, partial [Rhodospirillaceae bacterium]
MYIIKENRNISLPASLLEENIIMLDRGFTPHMASEIIQQLLHLDHKTGKEPIQIYINSPGGCVVSGLAIYDTIKSLKKEVITMGIGMCASMGAFMLTCGAKKGNRYITP